MSVTGPDIGMVMPRERSRQLAGSSPAALLVTPDENDRLVLPDDRAGIYPLAFDVRADGMAADRLRMIGSVVDDRHAELAKRSVGLTTELTSDIVRCVFGADDPAKWVLYLDRARDFVEGTIERLLRLEACRRMGAGELYPSRLSLDLPMANGGADYTIVGMIRGHRLIWTLFRLLAGADDHVTLTAAAASSLRDQALERLRCSGRELHAVTLRRGCLFGHKLGRVAQLLQDVFPEMKPIPDFMMSGGTPSAELRRRIADTFTLRLSDLVREFGGSQRGLEETARIFVHLVPMCLAENASENFRAYERFVRWARPSGVLTAVGHAAASDLALFMMAACIAHDVPVRLIQHGGLQGYDGVRPVYFTREMVLPVTVVSPGWTEVAPTFQGMATRARVVPLPDPYLSELAMAERAARPAHKTRTLLVPLQKVRTLAELMGQAVRDDNVEAMRRTTAEVLRLCADDFDRIVLTYRTQPFEKDPLHRFLDPAVRRKLEVHHFRDAPAKQLFRDASAVFWDVPSTGLLESLVCGIPTVTLIDPSRRGMDVSWAERLLTETGVGACDAPSAAIALRSFVTEPGTWDKAQTTLERFLDTFARWSPEWRSAWRNFIAAEATRGA
jgi:hypothetical protein